VENPLGLERKLLSRRSWLWSSRVADREDRDLRDWNPGRLSRYLLPCFLVLACIDIKSFALESLSAYSSEPTPPLSDSDLPIRYHHSDSDQIDSEKELSIEHYNDVDSYQLPIAWDQDWQHFSSGARASGGSLNQTRFYYQREIKFHHLRDNLLTSREPGPYLTFDQVTLQDKLADVTYNTLAVGYLKQAWEIAVLADGDSHKKWSDLGMRLGTFLPIGSLHASIWSIDHYYNTKVEPASGNKFDKKPIAYEWLWQSNLKENMAASLRYSIQTPLRHRGPLDIYEMAAQELNASIRSQWDVGHSLGAQIQWQQKQESRQNLLPEPTRGQMKRIFMKTTLWQDLAFSSGRLHQDLTLRERRADYQFDFPVEEAPSTLVVEPSSYRIEPSWNARWYPGPRDGASFFYGSHQHWPRITNARVRAQWESKALVGWQYTWPQKGHFSLLSTWDLDQLFHDFPYSKTTFKPWGGGAIQFQLSI
jgi:hypothetical protein